MFHFSCRYNPQPRKNIPLVIRSILRRREQLPPWPGGSRPLDERSKRLIRKLQTTGTAGRILRAVECRTRISPALSGVRGLCFPPLTKALTAGAEALQCAVGSYAESVAAEVAGPVAILVDPNDEAAITHAIVDPSVLPGVKS
jgi:hypothetical protein